MLFDRCKFWDPYEKYGLKLHGGGELIMQKFLRYFICLFVLIFLNISPAMGIDIVFNIADIKKSFPEPMAITTDTIRQWVNEDINSNKDLSGALQDAEKKGLTQVVFTDETTIGWTACTNTEICICLSSLSPSSKHYTNVNDVREAIRQNLCFELANKLNDHLNECTHNLQAFTNAQAYADAAVLAEAETFVLARKLFMSTWTPNSESQKFFAMDAELRDLTTYRNRHSDHYKRYVQQYRYHTTPGFKEETEKMMKFAINTLQSFIALVNTLKQKHPKSFDAESKNSFLQGVDQYHDSYASYIGFLMNNKELLEDTSVESMVQTLAIQLNSGDKTLQGWVEKIKQL